MRKLLTKTFDLWGPLSYRRISVLGILLSGFLAALLFFVVWRQEYAFALAHFTLDAEATAHAVQYTLDYSTHDFASVRSLYRASGNVTRTEFATFVADQFETNPLPGLLALEWIPYVKAGQRTQFEQAAQAEGMRNFFFTERDKEGRFVRAAQREAYYPVYYVAPQARLEYILGFDLGSDATRLPALQQARDSGKAAVITATMFIPSSYEAKGSLIFLPVYEPAVPLTSVQDRRNHLRGFLAGIFDLQSLLASSQDARLLASQNLYLFDPALPAQQQLVLAKLAGAQNEKTDVFAPWRQINMDQVRSDVYHEHEIQVYDHSWRIIITPANQLGGLVSSLPLNTALVVFSFSMLATAYIAKRRQAEESLQQSEEQYRLVVTNVSDVIWSMDILSLKVQFVTPSVSALLGMSADEALLLPLEQTLGPESRAMIRTTILQRIAAAQNGMHGPYVDRISLLRRDGSQVWTETTSHFATDPQSGRMHMYGISRDITEWRRGERIQSAQFAVSRILAQSPNVQEAISQVLESLAANLDWPAAEFWQRSEDGSHLEWCTGWWKAEHSDLDRFMTLSRTHTFVPGQGLVGRAWQENQALWEDHVSSHPEYPRHQIGKAAGLQSAVCIPICIDDQALGVMVFHDRSPRPIDEPLLKTLADLGRQIAMFIARKQAEVDLHNERALLAQRVQERTADLSRANDELAHALRAKDEFLANMSHELRTPLNGILTLGESLQEGTYGPLNSYQKKSLGLIQQSGYHLLALINDILDLAKVEAGKLELQLECVSAQAVSQASIALVSELATRKAVQLSLRGEAGDVELLADPRRLKQILVNLLGNAIKFTPAGGHVLLSVTQQPHAIQFCVQDDGIGIPAAQQSKLFQPFTQLDAGLARQYEGTGLGLALVRRLVELHHGQIDVQSTGISGQGSRFFFSIPRSDHSAARVEVDGIE